jgi:hypothetical protein
MAHPYIVVHVLLNDRKGTGEQIAFIGRVAVSSVWTGNFSEARAIGDAIAETFLRVTEGKPRTAFKEYDVSFHPVSDTEESLFDLLITREVDN